MTFFGWGWVGTGVVVVRLVVVLCTLLKGVVGLKVATGKEASREGGRWPISFENLGA